MAYALSFAQQFLDLGHTDLSLALLATYTRTRAERNLPLDRRALALQAKALSCRAEAQRRAIGSANAALRMASTPAERATLEARRADAEGALATTVDAERRAVAVLSAHDVASDGALTSMVEQMALGRESIGGGRPTAARASLGGTPFGLASPAAGGWPPHLAPARRPMATTPLMGAAPLTTPWSLGTPSAAVGGAGGRAPPASPAFAAFAAAAPAAPSSASPRAPSSAASRARLSTERLSLGGAAAPAAVVDTGGRAAPPPEAARWALAGGLGTPGSPAPLVSDGSSGRHPPLSRPAEVPTPPTATQRRAPNGSLVGGSGAARRQSGLAEPAGGGGALGAMGGGGGGGGGCSELERWRVRSSALRGEAEAMLAVLPHRQTKRTPAGDAAGGEGSWVYRYLLYEPVGVVGAGGADGDTFELLGTAREEAAKAGALWSIAMRLASPTSRQGSAAGRGHGHGHVHLRLFTEVAPGCIAHVHAAMRAVCATADARASLRGVTMVGGTTQRTADAAVVIPLPAPPATPTGSDAGSVTAAAATERGRVPHARQGLVCFRPPAAAGGGDGGELAFSLGPAGPTGDGWLVIGRIVDGEHALVRLIGSDSGGAPGAAALSVARWQPTELHTPISAK